MSRLMVRRRRWSSRAIGSALASAFFAASTSQAVPIDLTDATPMVTSATGLQIEGIATLGSSYWADFEWNEKTNKFDVVAYGETEEAPPVDGFVLIEAGTFTMGSPSDEMGRGPQDETRHDVTLSRDFYLATTPVTQVQWIAAMGSRPSYFSGCDDCPVEQVSWYEAVDYCNALSEAENLEPAYEVNGTSVSWNRSAEGYRLPTESEWEYSCRAVSVTAFYNGPITDPGCNDPNLEQVGWYCGNASSRTHEVGQKSPNAWGLYDTSGNVNEWCWDRYAGYPAGPVTDPTGAAAGALRVLRGGSWLNNARHCRSAFRDGYGPDNRNSRVGLRPARSAP